MESRRSNNGMHPTANSAALIGNLCGFEVECAAGDARRWAATLILRDMYALLLCLASLGIYVSSC